jgi:hypothetical protein
MNHMLQQFLLRAIWQSAKESWIVQGCLWVWGFLGVYDLALSQLLTAEAAAQYPKAHMIAAWVPNWAYPVGMSLIFAFAAYRYAASQVAKMAELTGGIGDDVPEAVVEQFIRLRVQYDLGRPNGEITSKLIFVRIEHENVLVLWSEEESSFLMMRSGSKKLEKIADPLPQADPVYFDDDTMRLKTLTPPTKLPPLGGLGRLWEIDRASWEWMGYRIRAMQYAPGSVFVQHCKAGRIIGPLPSTIPARSTFYVVRSDLTYETIHSSSIAAPSPSLSMPP